MAIANEKCTSPIIEEPQEHILKGKLRESRRKVGQLVILDMVSLLFGTVRVIFKKEKKNW